MITNNTQGLFPSSEIYFSQYKLNVTSHPFPFARLQISICHVCLQLKGRRGGGRKVVEEGNRVSHKIM